MKLVDREFQLTALDLMLADTVEGRGRIALVSGVLGGGKTALLQAFADRSVLTGATFVSAAGSWAERELRFGVLSQILLDTTVSAHGRRMLSAPALCLRLLELAEQKPLVIGIDDAHLADQASLYCLLSLARRLRSARVMFVFTESAHPRELRSPFHLELLRLPQCSLVRLEPLTLPGVAALAGQRDAPRIHALSRGNPLLVQALLSDDLPTAVVRCLHHGGPVVRHTAQAIAMLGESATPAAISRLIGVDTQAITHAVRVLTAAGLLGGGRFRHPGTRDTVLSGTTPAKRCLLHARTAWMLHQRGEAAEIVACHLLEGPPHWPEWVVPVLRTAAARADQRTAFALSCLELARKSSVDPVEKAAITAELAQLEFRSNPLAAARHLSALCEAMRAGHLDRDTEVVVVSQLLWHGRVDDALDLVRDNESVELWLASACPSLAQWHRLDSPLTALLVRGEDAGRADGVLRGARLTGDLPWAAVFALLTLIYADRLDNAAAWCDRLLEQAGDHLTWQAMFAGVRAEISLRQGDLRAARRLAGIAFDLLSPRAWGTAVVVPLSCLILACTRTGQYVEAGEYVALPVPEVAFRTRFGLHYLHARGEYHLATGRPEAALADFTLCGELMRSWGQDHPGVVPWRARAAQALLGQGSRERARRLLVDQLALTTQRSRTRGLTLRVLASMSTRAVRARMLTEAAEILEERGDRFGLAQALADLSGVLSHRPRARMIARRAWHVARECGAKPLYDRLLPDDDPVPEQVAALTEAERRVAALAGDGHTNREIARRLFVTTSTVEQHLTRVYRKLDIRYRRELPAGSCRRPHR